MGRPSTGMSISDAADRVGVAATTLRTWERRYGVATARRTPGGHRRYTVEDVARLQEIQRLVATGMTVSSAAARALAAGTPPAGARRRTERGAGSLRTEFGHTVRELDFVRATRAAADLLEGVGAVRAWVDEFTPHLQAAGHRWARTQRYVEREHLSSAAIHTALTEYARARIDGTRPCALLAAATPTERHTLPLDALLAAAAERGVHGCTLGTLPPEALRDAAGSLRPSVLVLWSRSDHTATPALLDALVRDAPTVCSAGPGWSRHATPKAVTHLPDLATAVDTVTAWAT